MAGSPIMPIKRETGGGVTPGPAIVSFEVIASGRDLLSLAPAGGLSFGAWRGRCSPAATVISMITILSPVPPPTTHYISWWSSRQSQLIA